jgi:hypothetical protein
MSEEALTHFCLNQFGFKINNLLIFLHLTILCQYDFYDVQFPLCMVGVFEFES